MDALKWGAPPDGRCLYTAPCGIWTKWPSGRRTPLYPNRLRTSSWHVVEFTLFIWVSSRNSFIRTIATRLAWFEARIKKWIRPRAETSFSVWNSYHLVIGPRLTRDRREGSRHAFPMGKCLKSNGNAVKMPVNFQTFFVHRERSRRSLTGTKCSYQICARKYFNF